MPQFPYTLDPSSKKTKCPQCGHTNTFVVYLDTETKQAVDPYQFGRCDRENNCGYHLHPSDNPDLAAKKKEDFVPTPDPTVVQIFPGENIYNPIIKKTKTCVSPLHVFLNKTLLIPNDHLMRWGVYSDKEDLTVYIFRNFNQEVVNVKWFKYKEDGHRDKNFNSYSLKNPKPPTPPDQKNLTVEKYQMCLFGEHLLPRELDNVPVIIVESEKTAAIASFFYKQFHWLACGSANGVSDGHNGSPNKISILKGREVYWLSDADKAGRMTTDDKGKITPSSIRHLIEHIEKFHIVELFPDRNDGYDIGDAIVDGLRPEIIPTWSKGKDQVEMAKAVKEVLEGEDQDLVDYDLPDGVKWADVKWDVRKYMHFEHKGRIYIVRKRKSNGGEFESKGVGSYYCSPISNFTIKSLGLIASELEPTRLLEIKNIHGDHQVVKVPTKSFVSPSEFTAFMEGVGNFQYDGVGIDLKKIRSKLYDTMLTFDEVENLGWHYTGYFLFANGSYNGKFTPIDKYGFVKLGEKNFFIQPLSCIIRENSEDWEDEKKFIFKEKADVSLKDWAKLFCKVHKDNGIISLAWYIASLFRDVIYQRFKFFPHLHLFGPPGTGKSQIGWSVRALGFSGLVKPFNLNTGTAVAFHREFSHFKNFPAWCDEYSNSIPFERIQALKAAYDGVGHKKSVKDSEKRTKSTQVNRSVMISGQELPIADNALFKRVILLQFHQTEYSAEEKKMFGDLQTMEEGGLSFITAGFMHFRKDVEEKYYEAFDDVLTDLMKEITAQEFEVEDRIARNATVALTVIKVLETRLGDRLPFNYEQLKLILVKNIKEQMSLISNSNETNQFWDTVMFLAMKGDKEGGIKEGEDYNFEDMKRLNVEVNGKDQVREFASTTELVFIRFGKVIPLYREAFKRQNTSNSAPMDKGSLIHYLTNSKPFIGLVSKRNFKDSRTSCYCFDYGMLKSMGIYLGGSENHGGSPPPSGFSGGPNGANPVVNLPKGGQNDLPF